MRLLAVLLVLLLLAQLPTEARAETAPYSASTPLEFNQTFTALAANANFSQLGITFTESALSQFGYDQHMVLQTQSSEKYAESGKTCSIQVTTQDDESVLGFSSHVGLTISWNFGGTTLPGIGQVGIKGSQPLGTFDVAANQAVTAIMGSPQNISLGKFLLYSGTIPGVGVEFNVFLRPVLQWASTLSGGMGVTGSAQVNPDVMTWTSPTATAQLRFNASSPVSLALTNPILSLQNFRLRLYFPVTVLFTSFDTYSVDIIARRNYSMSAPTLNLISFEPNTFSLLTQLSSSVAGIASALSSTQATLNSAIHNGSVTVLSTLPGRIDALNKSIAASSQYLGNSLNVTRQELQSLESNINSKLADIQSQLGGQLTTLTVVGVIALLALGVGLARHLRRL